MNSVSEEIQSLCEAIIISHKNREKYIKGIIKEAKDIREETRSFLSKIRADSKEAKRVWKKMRKTLKLRKRSEAK